MRAMREGQRRAWRTFESSVAAGITCDVTAAVYIYASLKSRMRKSSYLCFINPIILPGQASNAQTFLAFL